MSDESLDILRFQFESAAERAQKGLDYDDVASCFYILAATVDAVPAPLVRAYLEFFEDYVDAERDAELMNKIRFRCWFPANATEYLEQYIAGASGLG